MKYKRCSCCVNDTTVKGINFDENGVCNFCNTYQKYQNKLLDFKNLEQNFKKRIMKEQGKHKYDVALGFSGGKDSTYVLLKLVKEYNLHVYAYTLDNGFLSDEAKSKIDKIVNELNVDHDYIKTDEVLLKKMYHLALTKFLSPCIACSYLGYAVMINMSVKVDAAVGIHGRSRPQMLRRFASDIDDTFKDFVISGLDDVDNVDFKSLYLNSLNKIDKYIDKDIAKTIKETLLKESLEEGFRDFIAYFLYHPYDVNNIVLELEKTSLWKPLNEVEHFDCEIHNAATFIKNKVARRLHIMPELSVMIREKTESKENCLKMLDNKNIPCPVDELDKLCKYAHVNKKMLLLKANIYAKRWW